MYSRKIVVVGIRCFAASATSSFRSNRGDGITMRAPLRPLTAALNAPSNSLDLRASTVWSCRLKERADDSAAGSSAGFRAGSLRRATRMMPGIASLSSSNALPVNSGRPTKIPVRFPPGRAKLAMKPLATGSDSRSSPTTGIVFVAFVAALIADELTATITSTLRRAASAAYSRSRSSLPPANRSSMRMFWPCT